MSRLHARYPVTKRAAFPNIADQMAQNWKMEGGKSKQVKLMWFMTG